MNVRINDSYEEMSAAAAEFVIDQLHHKPDSVIGLAAGGTPCLLYQMLGEACAAGKLDFSCVRTFSLDEYIGLAADDPQEKQGLVDRLEKTVQSSEYPSGAD